MMKAGVFRKDEIQFGHITDSPQETVELILAILAESLRPRVVASKLR
jgi:hypothetical protein